MSEPFFSGASIKRHATCIGMLRAKKSPEDIAAKTGLTLAEIAEIARIHAPKKKQWTGKRRR